jgi:hypothetical protein
MQYNGPQLLQNTVFGGMGGAFVGGLSGGISSLPPGEQEITSTLIGVNTELYGGQVAPAASNVYHDLNHGAK